MCLVWMCFIRQLWIELCMSFYCVVYLYTFLKDALNWVTQRVYVKMSHRLNDKANESLVPIKLQPMQNRRKRRRVELILIKYLTCSNPNCSLMISDVEATSNLSVQCDSCLFIRGLRPQTGGFPFEMVDDQQLLHKQFECPICLMIVREAIELPCHHLMCSSCLQKNEGLGVTNRLLRFVRLFQFIILLRIDDNNWFYPRS